MKFLKTLFLLHLILLSCQTENKKETRQEQPLNKKLAFWQDQQKGTNYFNQTPTKEWFKAAHDANIKFVRLVYDKWKREQAYFLMGSADHYEGIVEKDFLQLKGYLDYADSLDIKVVICPISIPGEKWRQSNNGKNDGRLWKNFEYADQVARFWRDLAIRLRDHPAVVGYNLVNEPHPEIYFNKYSFWKRDLQEWYETVKGMPADLNLFNKKIVQAIRTVDTATPIILESGLYATPWAFDYLEPLADDKIIYSFHMYEPYSFTNKKLNKGQYKYGGTIPIEETNEDFELNRESLIQFFQPINEWCEKHKIPTNRIWVGEFGCNRHIEGVEDYLKDLISIFNQHQWHWSFYAFREDVWEAMDYELGTEKVFYKYWEYQAANELHLKYEEMYSRVKDKKVWTIIEKEFE